MCRRLLGRGALIASAITMLWFSVLSVQAGVQVTFRAPQNKAEAAAVQLLKKAQVAKRTADFTTSTFTLGTDLHFEFGAEDGPLYDPERRTIAMPYEFPGYVRETFARSGESFDTDELDVIVIDVVEHVLYHELGHALIDVFDLPVVGKEEDAVDALATVLLIESFEEGADMVLSVADMFSLEDESSETDESSFWDEHSLDAQRFYSTLCLVYGSDPHNNAELVEDLDIEQDRLEQCPSDYEQQRLGWGKLLRPYLKDASAFADN